ncbi:hypothetical protein [uncultured Maribacter sp.]|nr:hypothetical protein [uncultured Maribacter sp.]
MIVLVVVIPAVVIGTLVFVSKKHQDSLRPIKVKANNKYRK